MTTRIGLEALLSPDRSVLLLIDHQPFQFANLNSHDPTLIINNVVGLAKAAKAFNVPTILTTVTEERGGYLLKGIQDVYPQQKPINRGIEPLRAVTDDLDADILPVVAREVPEQFVSLREAW
jgi:nicotinamidase-related amidase